MEVIISMAAGWIIGIIAGLLFIGFCEIYWKRIIHQQKREEQNEHN